MTAADRALLRELAQRVHDIAHSPLNVERRQRWTQLHDGGTAVRPLILAEAGSICDERKPFEFRTEHATQLRCQDPWARGVEQGLRAVIWRFEELQDDHVVEPFMDVQWRIQGSGFGIERVIHRVDEGEHLTACSWEAPITDIAADFHKLKHRTFSVDRAGTLAEKAKLDELLGDLLPTRFRGGYWWTFGLTIQAIDLIGLEGLMLKMYDDPEGLHRVMAFLRDDNLAYACWCEQEGLLNFNNGNDYIGSGSEGYVSALPQVDWRPGMPVRLKDLWLLLESQETVGVSPELFAEFILPYHQDLAAHFGLVYYGCCEPLHTRWAEVKTVPHLRACSIAPLCNQEIMAAALQGDYVYSRKPNPTLISTGVFNEELIREDLRMTLRLAKQHGCRLELIMKDVHTLNNEPWRLARWVALAREEIARIW